MTMVYEYVVLRLSPDIMRGEYVNIGLVVFPAEGKPSVRLLAPISKVRALDPTWNSIKHTHLRAQIEDLLSEQSSTECKVEKLVRLGLVHSNEPGFFHASSETLEQEIRSVAAQYILSRVERKPRRANLHKEMVQRFKDMELLGSSIDDLPKHLVVPHVPIPQYPDLKADFVFKNGVYRITQTLDYRVSESAAHQKVAEACTKAMAAREGVNAWGEGTKKFALVCIPPEIADIADSHIDLLIANGFVIFHADKKDDLDSYHSLALSY